MLLATLDASITLIAMPDIFRGVRLDPLVPANSVYLDRWVSKYAEPWAATLTGLKKRIEEDVMEKVFEIYIKTTPERLWEAIIDSELRSKYS